MKRILLIAIACFIVLSGIVSWQIFRVTPVDKGDYLSLLSTSQDDELVNVPSTQHREGVRKDFYLYEKGQRLHTIISSHTSDLLFVRRDEGNDLVERMQGIECLMQVELRNHPELTQVVRLMQADRGLYDYRQNRFIAKKVTLSRFILPGHVLYMPTANDAPTMVGNAEGITLKLGKDLQFKARRLKLNIYQAEDSL